MKWLMIVVFVQALLLIDADRRAMRSYKQMNEALDVMRQWQSISKDCMDTLWSVR